jgi:hypothetical protein
VPVAFVALANLALAFSLTISQSQAANPQQEAEMRAQQAAQREQQQAMQRSQEEAQRNQQQAMQRSQEEAQRNQQQAMQRAQQEAQRNQQQATQRAQEEAQRDSQQAMQRAQEESQRNSQQAMQRAQEESQRNTQQAMQRAQQERARQQEEASRSTQEEAMQRSRAINQVGAQRIEREEHPTAVYGGHQGLPVLPTAAAELGNHKAQMFGEHAFFKTPQGQPVVRPTTPPALQAHAIQLARASALPRVASNFSGQQRQQANLATSNLQNHLIALPPNQVPQNFQNYRNQQLNNYFNNYPAVIGGQPYYINRANTYLQQVQPGYYPNWYQPQPGWGYYNGFIFGNSLTADQNWLGWGWQPYWGPPPMGFISSSDFVPTPWIYVPAYDCWRQPGMDDCVQNGPPYDYTGPISVEVVEPVANGYGGGYGDYGGGGPVTNTLCLYNAFYNPDAGRWGYVNRNGYFFWLNI